MKYYAVIGFPLSHSFSPQIHNAAFRFLNMDAEYVKQEIPPDDFERCVAALKTQDWRGFNVTVPFKERIVSFVDELDDTARIIGAVNTIQIEAGGRWKGFNTDAYGFLQPLQALNSVPRSILLIGAGGAARAVLYALITQYPQVKLSLANRTISKAQKLARDFSVNTSAAINTMDLAQAESSGQKYDLVVNTTSVGMGALRGLKPLILRGLVHENSIVYDLIYNPEITILLREAEELGVRTFNGWPMLLHQAAKSFEIWSGIPFPQEVLRDLLKKPL